MKWLSVRGKERQLEIKFSGRYSVRLDHTKYRNQHIYISKVKLKDLLAVSHKRLEAGKKMEEWT